MGHTQNRNRRRLLAAGTAASIGLLSGCLGDDADDQVDDGVADEDDVADDDDGIGDDEDDATLADDSDDAEPTEREEEDIERYDVTAVGIGSGDPPADVQYNSLYDGPTPDWAGRLYYHPVAFMNEADPPRFMAPMGEWDYQPGLITYEFYDDFYWWDGAVINADDILLNLEFDDYNWGGDELQANEAIVTSERIDEFTFQLALRDTWTEAIALSRQNTLEDEHITRNRNWLEPWLEQFRDAGDLDAIEDIRDAIGDHPVDANNNPEEMLSFYHSPFEFRFDGDEGSGDAFGDLGTIDENGWTFELVPEKNGNRRHYVDELNYTKLRFEYYEEPRVHLTEGLQSGRAYGADSFMDSSLFDEPEELPFPNEIHTSLWDRGEWGFHFIHNVHPGENPHFRRAFAYMCDKTLWAGRPGARLQEYEAPLWVESTKAFVSEEVFEAFTSYGPRSVLWDEAELEMLEGGFERNGNGQWMFIAETPFGDPGDPMDFEIGNQSWQTYVGEEGTDFYLDMDEFGISMEVIPERDPEYPVIGSYHSNKVPEALFPTTWGREDPWHAPERGFPATVEAPPVGETAVAGDWGKDNWREYETLAMTDRLRATTEEGMYQQIVDELSWAHNQLVVRCVPTAYPLLVMTNTEYWQFKSPQEYPELWDTAIRRSLPMNGGLEYVGPEAGPSE